MARPARAARPVPSSPRGCDDGTMESAPPQRDPGRGAALIRDVILGGQDGLVNVLGLVLGRAVATGSSRIVITAGLAALMAESIAMAGGAFTASGAGRQVGANPRRAGGGGGGGGPGGAPGTWPAADGSRTPKWRPSSSTPWCARPTPRQRSVARSWKSRGAPRRPRGRQGPSGQRG